MTITIELPSEPEERLHQYAARAGVRAAEFALGPDLACHGCSVNLPP